MAHHYPRYSSRKVFVVRKEWRTQHAIRTLNLREITSKRYWYTFEYCYTTIRVNETISHRSINFPDFRFLINIRFFGVLQIQLFRYARKINAAGISIDTIKTERLEVHASSIRVVDNVGGISYTVLSIFHSISVSKSVQCIYNLGTCISAFRRRSRAY